MHKHLSCTLSRLSSSEPVAIIRVSGDLPGLHPIHLYWFRARMTDVPFATVTGDARLRPLPLQVLLNPHRRGARMRPFLPPHTMVASGRFCCKSRFALVVGNSAGRRCAFRVRMWGASSPHVKLTGDFANVSDAIRIGDCFPFRNFAKNQSPCNFRLLQQYRAESRHANRSPLRANRVSSNNFRILKIRHWRQRAKNCQ